VKPLTSLLEKGKEFKWDEACQNCFEELEKRLTTAPILVMPDIHKGFDVYCDASHLGLRCVLMQEGKVIPYVSAFRDRGVPGPTSECRRVPQPRWVEREGEREGGRARRPETGVREVGIPRPSCSSRAQVGCACSRGLQASTRERERAAPSERLSRPRPRAANLL
jgi:hypothetical protein